MQTQDCGLKRCQTALFLKVSSIVGSHVDQDDFHYDMIFYIFSISVGVHSEFVNEEEII